MLLYTNTVNSVVESNKIHVCKIVWRYNFYTDICISFEISVQVSIFVDNTPYILRNMYSFVQWWRNERETFSALLAICAGNSPNSPHKGQWRRALMFSLICVWINGGVNNSESGDLRRHRAHYDVIAMLCCFLLWFDIAWFYSYFSVSPHLHMIKDTIILTVNYKIWHIPWIH